MGPELISAQTQASGDLSLGYSVNRPSALECDCWRFGSYGRIRSSQPVLNLRIGAPTIGRQQFYRYLDSSHSS